MKKLPKFAAAVRLALPSKSKTVFPQFIEKNPQIIGRSNAAKEPCFLENMRSKTNLARQSALPKINFQSYHSTTTRQGARGTREELF